MFRKFKQAICKHHYQFVGKREVLEGIVVFKGMRTKVNVVCPKCEKSLEMTESEWELLDKRQKMLKSYQTHNNDWADF